MHSLILAEKIKYDGSQLAPLKNYLSHGLMGDSLVAWLGPCDVDFAHMIDGEDLRQRSAIKAELMMHLILEIFNQDLYAGIFLQRLIGEHVRQLLIEMGNSSLAVALHRQGDDLYWQKRKLNVSIATCAQNSFLIHFGVNVTNAGTPVPTCALSDFQVESPNDFLQRLVTRVTSEVAGQKQAFYKVRTF